MGYIYKITNNINNKSYIGQTIRHYGQRWRNHRSEAFNIESSKYNFIASFSSITEASNQTGINGLHISGVCLGKRKTAGGYKWKRN